MTNKRQTNLEFSKLNEKFITSCKKVNLIPNKRQASKWRMKKGKAWKAGR